MKTLREFCIKIDHQTDQIMRMKYFTNSVPFFKIISKEFSLFLSLVIPLIGWLMARKQIWIFVLGAGTGAFVLAKWMKGLVGRKRPQETNRSTFRLDQEAGSFPSRHAAVLAAECTVLLVSHSVWASPWIVACLLVSISRIVLREHYVSDIIAGISLGILAGLIVGFIKGVVTA